jgi:hypothetical protein
VEFGDKKEREKEQKGENQLYFQGGEHSLRKIGTFTINSSASISSFSASNISLRVQLGGISLSANFFKLLISIIFFIGHYARNLKE